VTALQRQEEARAGREGRPRRWTDSVAVAADIDQARRGVERVPRQRDLLLDRSHFAHHHRSAMQARANLCRRAELALVVCAVRDQPSERGEAGAHAGRVPQPRASGQVAINSSPTYLCICPSQHDRPAEISYQAVEQPMEVDLAQSLRSRGRACSTKALSEFTAAPISTPVRAPRIRPRSPVASVIDVSYP